MYLEFISRADMGIQWVMDPQAGGVYGVLPGKKFDKIYLSKFGLKAVSKIVLLMFFKYYIGTPSSKQFSIDKNNWSS